MKLHLEGWDTEREAYRVTRSYTPDKGRHNFAWFVDDEEARRFIELYRPLGDPDAERATHKQGGTGDTPSLALGRKHGLA